ncbi:MAG: hypothetical protein A3G41_03670 [Elusimicrobia bacterium RIFCSPLOWO2_12_FULL_59_9]|nr:MAG: hypothetical protein A3G41_03670 [Elusimicrobia bacterium RIFCSPLOWO2_12_FULL_59_9]
MGEPLWPFPERIEAGPLVNYGYGDELFLTVPVKWKKTPAKSIVFDLNAEWLVCKEECIPAFGKFKAILRVEEKTKPNPAWRVAHARALPRLPRKNSGWRFEASREGETLRLRLHPPAGEPVFESVEFFPYDGSLLEHAARQEIEWVKNRITLGLRAVAEAASIPERMTGIVVVDRARAHEVDVAVKKASSSLAALLGFAFLGGLLLNLMPCVLPVLSIKVLGFLRYSQGEAHARMQGTLFAAGILVSFWVLAGLLIFLRALEQRIGWGFQLQSPVFLSFLAVLFVVLGLSLFGVFEAGASLGRAAGWTHHLRGWREPFFSGVVATLVATPCTAPFMGAAIGAALALPAAAVFAVFSALGAGMSAPYAAFTFYPRGLQWLPRPGAWMRTLKEALAFPLWATSVWLLWVLGRQMHWAGLGHAAAAAWSIVLAAWLWKKWTLRPIRAAAAVIALTGAGVVLMARPSTLAWETYSQPGLEAALSRGQDVLVNFTAAWCVTCQVNERTVFNRRKVRKALQRSGLVLMKADWTSRDAEIASALERLGRSGVPLYAIFSPQAAPRLLPALLTPRMLIDAVENGDGSRRYGIKAATDEK